MGKVAQALGISRGNLIAAGLVVLFIVPMMFTSCIHGVVPGGLGFTAPIVCPTGSHLRFETESYRTQGGRSESYSAYCVASSGRDVGGNVFPKCAGIVYGAVLLVWGALLAMVFRPRKGDVVASGRVGDRPTAGP